MTTDRVETVTSRRAHEETMMTTDLLPTALTIDRYTSPVDDLLVVTDEAGTLRAVSFADGEPRMTAQLARHYPGLALVAGSMPAAIRSALDAYFAGDHAALHAIPTATGGTAFQRAVWAALREVPIGATASYRDIATRLGDPKAVRAVGMANNANPISIVVPCHRVIGADGSMTGYGGGLERKRWLLAHEGVAVAGPPLAGSPATRPLLA